MDMGKLANADSFNPGMVEVVVNRRNLYGFKLIDFSQEIAQRKGLEDVDPRDLSPTDPDLIAVLKAHQGYPWPRTYGYAVYIATVPKGTRFILQFVECEDSWYDEELLIVLEDSKIFTA